MEVGVKEVILTGINIADYGFDFYLCLEDLVEAILTKTKLKQLKVSSLDPGEVTPRLLELMKKNSALMPHFHVSLQSANSRVLRAMKRKYRQEQVVDCLNQIRSE